MTNTAHTYKSSHSKILDFASDKTKRETLDDLIEELYSLGWINLKEINSYKLCDWFLILEWCKWIVKCGKAKAKGMTHCVSCNNNSFYCLFCNFNFINDSFTHWSLPHYLLYAECNQRWAASIEILETKWLNVQMHKSNTHLNRELWWKSSLNLNLILWDMGTCIRDVNGY